MRIALVGKGGSGKTTISALFDPASGCRRAGRWSPWTRTSTSTSGWLSAFGRAGRRAEPDVGAHLTEIKDYLRGDNPLIRAATMVKTTPPGPGSRLLRLGGDEPDPRRALRGWPATWRPSG